MQSLPHHYKVQASSTPASQLTTSSTGLPDIITDGPAEFGGSGDLWSPETLLMSAVASCFILSFKAVAAASKFSWQNITCETTGKLEKVERSMQFTEITTQVKLQISDPQEKDKALKLLDKSESICLVTNSLTAKQKLECTIVIE